MAEVVNFAHAPYEVVAAAFADFAFDRQVDSRGGVTTTKCPYLGEGAIVEGRKIGPIAPDYHVEMTFSEDQRGFVAATTRRLADLANGKVFTPNLERVPPLSQGIGEYFLEGRWRDASFTESLLDATVDVFDDFAHYYPNLMPAFDAMTRVAGIEGTQVAILRAAPMLCWALSGDLNRENIESFRAEKVDHNEFVFPHLLGEGKPLAYEIWCPGENFAKSIVHQAKLAALALTEIAFEGRNYYVHEFDFHKDIVPIQHGLTTYVSGLVARSRMLQSEF